MEYLVTSIRELTSKRRLVYVNEERAFALYTGELRKYNIHQGECIPVEVYTEIISVLSRRAIIRGMNLLKSKDYTEAEFKKKLRDGYYPSEAVEAALSYVREYGYIDDERYAQNYVAFKAGSKSRRMVQAFLMNKGVSAQIIESVCDEYYNEHADSELQQIVSQLEKKCRNISINSMEYNERQKLKAYFYRKGFRCEVIDSAMDLVSKYQEQS